jgi:Skp family chaperone for outer membrane proteins|tara:strand:- start:261 stop:881 length:621 start_codon:yes stop_codon:yes gene_type:complete
MKIFKFFTALLFGVFLSAPLSAQDKDDKIGTVNMQKLLRDYYKFEQTSESLKGYQKEMQKQNEARAEAVKALAEESRKLQKQAEDPALTREKKGELFREATGRQEEAQALQNERISWIQRKNAALSEKANVEFSDMRLELIKMVQEVAEAQGYDFIFDRSGASGANVPILSYAKDAKDLTAVMLERINRDAPAKTGEEEKDADKNK